MTKKSAVSWQNVAAVVLVVCMLGAWMWATHKKYEGYVFSTGDTAVAEQALWNTVFTHRLFHQSFLIGNEFNLREHLNIVQFLYLPLYALVPHTLTLLFIIQALFAAGALTLYFYVARSLGWLAAYLVLALWLLHPLTLKQVIGPMHVVAIGGVFFLWLLMAYRERWYKRFLVLVLAMALVSEFVAPTLFLVGVLALWQRRGWKWVLPPMVAGAALQLAAKFYITVGFGSSGYLKQQFLNALHGEIPKFAKRVKRVGEWLAPLAWVLPLASRYSILLVPSLLIALVIIIYGRINGGSHVFVLIPPVLVMIFVELAARWRGKWRQKALFAVVALWLVLAGVPHFLDRMDFKTSVHKEALDAAVRQIKDGGSVTADASVGPHVNRRAEFFLPDNRQQTDYVLLKRSKYADKKRKKRPELETRKILYRRSIAESGAYRVVFRQGRVTLWVKKAKIAQLLRLEPAQVDALSDAQLAAQWNALPTPTPRNAFGWPMPQWLQ